MDDRRVFRLIAVILATLAVVLGLMVYLTAPRTFRVAVGPRGSVQVAYLENVAKALEAGRESIRLRIVVTEGSPESSALLDAGKVDLAVLRSDDETSREARALVVLQKRAILIISPADAKVDSAAALRGKTIGVINGESDSNTPLVRKIIAHYGLGDGEPKTIEIPINELPAAVSEKKADAFIIAPFPAAGRLRALFRQISQNGKIDVEVAGMPSSEALAYRFKDLESITVPAGVFGGTNPKPEKPVETVALTYDLAATTRMSDYVATEITKKLMELRPRLRQGEDANFVIETPSVEAVRRYLPHPGSAAVVNQTAKTLYESYSDQIWLGLWMLSLLGSSVTAFIGWIGLRKPTSPARLKSHVPRLIDQLTKATTQAEVDAIEDDFDDALARMVSDFAGGRVSADSIEEPGRIVPLFKTLVDHRRAAIARAAVATAPPPDETVAATANATPATATVAGA